MARRHAFSETLTWNRYVDEIVNEARCKLFTLMRILTFADTETKVISSDFMARIQRPLLKY